jgi:hypothetical protein
MTKDEALRLALEALQSGDYWRGVAAVNAIKQALEETQGVFPEPEPVGYSLNGTFYKVMQFKAEGGAWDGQIPVYEQPQAREPLTDEQRKYVVEMWKGGNWTAGDIIDAVEAAHGITPQGE